jgi:hypothetical protein
MLHVHVNIETQSRRKSIPFTGSTCPPKNERHCSNNRTVIQSRSYVVIRPKRECALAMPSRYVYEAIMNKKTEAQTPLPCFIKLMIMTSQNAKTRYGYPVCNDAANSE